MDTTISSVQNNRSQRNRWVPGVLLLVAVLVIMALLFAYQAAHRPAASASAANVISANILEEHYGLRVNLIAVTAAGGLVDVRLKVLDAEKARALLRDSKNFPAVKVAGSDIALFASEDARAQVANLKDGSPIMILYPNRGTAIKSGNAVNVMFGETQLESIVAR
jgi:hypothetical protein